MTLQIASVDYKAAAYAVEHWHYSKRMPVGKMVTIGAWEDGQYIGAVVFSRGANRYLLSPFGLEQTEGCELTRVALRAHQAPVSRIVALAVKLLRRLCPGLRILVSYADAGHGHVGGIYQAMGWVYTGTGVTKIHDYVFQGRRWHRRAFDCQFGRGGNDLAKRIGAVAVPQSEKYRYVLPLDAKMRALVEPMRKPYPKRDRSKESVASDHQSEEGVAIRPGRSSDDPCADPSRSLHSRSDSPATPVSVD